VACVVTDFEAHALWMGDAVDLYCVAEEETKARLVARGVASDRVVVTGIPVEVEVPLEFSPMRRKELVVYTVRRSNHETEAARDMLAANLPRFAAMITHTRPLDRIAEAFHQVEHRADGVGKLVIVCGAG